MKKMLFITPPDAEYGFLLGGAPQVAVEPAQADEALGGALADADMGLVIIDERLLADPSAERRSQGITDERLRTAERGWNGVLLLLPAPVRPLEPEEDFAARLIRKAIGYHVRINL